MADVRLPDLPAASAVADADIMIIDNGVSTQQATAAMVRAPVRKQVQDGSLVWCGTAGGTANALTLVLSPAVAAYVAGQRFLFIAAAANTGAVTVAVSGLSAKAVQNAGAALVSGNIVAGRAYSIVYTGSAFQIAAHSLVVPVPVATKSVSGISREATIAEAASGTSTTPSALPHVTPEGVAAAIAPMGASVSTLAVSVTALETRASALENRLGYTILYPNGTESAPATVSANQRIVVVNPYGAVPCRVEVEVKISGVWGNSGHYTDGAIRSFVEAHTVDSNVIIQSGSTGVATNGNLSGSPFGDWGGSNSALYRLKIWKLAGA